MEDLLKAITILKNFKIDYDSVSKLQQAAKISWDNNIKPTDILMAIDLINEDEDDLAEEHMEQAIEDLEKTFKTKKFQQSK